MVGRGRIGIICARSTTGVAPRAELRVGRVTPQIAASRVDGQSQRLLGSSERDVAKVKRFLSELAFCVCVGRVNGADVLRYLMFARQSCFVCGACLAQLDSQHVFVRCPMTERPVSLSFAMKGNWHNRMLTPVTICAGDTACLLVLSAALASVHATNRRVNSCKLCTGSRQANVDMEKSTFEMIAAPQAAAKNPLLESLSSGGRRRWSLGSRPGLSVWLSP